MRPTEQRGQKRRCLDLASLVGKVTRCSKPHFQKESGTSVHTPSCHVSLVKMTRSPGLGNVGADSKVKSRGEGRIHGEQGGAIPGSAQALHSTRQALSPPEVSI